jgi:ABC-type nitrate/sulfonate/bicarbonate transport system ATPase subunit/ABC-type nitrate/sulfonate/bicarbonate transport system substrate-binding protein
MRDGVRRQSPSLTRRRALVGVAATGIGVTNVARAQTATLRIGHFPNITHIQALVARGMSRAGRGWFEQRLPGVKLEWFVYNAGPSAMEAIFANSIDLTYVGPNPAINAYVKSRGEEVRIIAGAASGGAALVVQPDLPLETAADFKGRRLATPQFGNTQDVSARAWLTAGGLRITQTGGDAQVIPTSNPDQVSLFKARRLDAVWTVEPWVSRLETEAGGKVLIDDREAVTTVVAASVKALAAKRDLVVRFAAAHRELTVWNQGQCARGEAIRASRDRGADPGAGCGRPCRPQLESDRADGRHHARTIGDILEKRADGRLPARGCRSRPPRRTAVTAMLSTGEAAISVGTSDPAPPKLQVIGVTKVFRTSRAEVMALDDVSLDVADGEFVCLVGPSGCGKSTLLDIIAGLTSPDSGRVLADGVPIDGPGRNRLVMFQEPALFPWLNVYGNVMFGLRLCENLTDDRRREIALEHIALVGLSKFTKSYVHELSGGMKQRVSLARALALDPQVLLMDEPMASLDALTREQLYSDIQRIHQQKRKTIILVTHNVREAVCLGDRIVLLSPHPGRIRETYVNSSPRPRDINSSDVSVLAQRITAALKGYMAAEPSE